MLTEQEFRDLLDRAQQIRELSQHPGWPVYADFVRDKAIRQQNALLAGTAQTFEEYKERAGWIQGAQFALDAPKHVETAVELAREQLEELKRVGAA